MKLADERINWVFLLRRQVLLGLAGLLLCTMLLLGVVLHKSLLDDNVHKTEELSDTLEASLRGLMLARDPVTMQSTLEHVTDSSTSIVRAFVANRDGIVAYSSDPDDIGDVLDRAKDASCVACHTNPEAAPRRHSILGDYDGQQVLRNVAVLENEAVCHECHDPSDPDLGVFIIDREMAQTYLLIAEIETAVAGAGLVSLVLMGLLWSRSTTRYARAIIDREEELVSLYAIVDRLSKSIDIQELSTIISGILHEFVNAETVDIIVPKDHGYRRMTRSADGKTPRRKDATTGPPNPSVQRWLDGWSEIETASDGSQILLPIVQDGVPSVLLIINRPAKPLDSVERRLLDVIGKHSAVAFENARLYTLAITDALTGLYTRRHFDNTTRTLVERAFSNDQNLCLMMIDVDNFKRVNDTYGHAAGDMVLREISAAVIAATRATDLAFRFGGDEIAIILPDIGIEEGAQIAKRIISHVGAIEFPNSDIRASVSIGIAAVPVHADTVNDLLAAADAAMYLAKKAGKNAFAVAPTEPRQPTE